MLRSEYITRDVGTICSVPSEQPGDDTRSTPDIATRSTTCLTTTDARRCRLATQGVGSGGRKAWPRCLLVAASLRPVCIRRVAGPPEATQGQRKKLNMCEAVVEKHTLEALLLPYIPGRSRSQSLSTVVSGRICGFLGGACGFKAEDRQRISALDEHEVDEGCPVFRRTTVTHIVSSLDPSWVESRVRRRMFGFARRWKQFILCTFWALAALDFAEVEGSGAGVRKIVRAASGDQGTPEAQRRGTSVGRSSGISTRAPPTRTPRITVRLFRAQNTVSSKPCSLRGAMLRRHCFRSSSACYAVRCQ